MRINFFISNQAVIGICTGRSTHRLGEVNFSHFLCPSGSAISPNLPRYQWLEVCKYVCTIDASYLRRTCQLQDLGVTIPQTSMAGLNLPATTKIVS